MTREVRARPPRAGDPYGVGPISTWVAPVLSIVGLLLIAFVTVNLFNYDLPFGIGGTNHGGTGNGGTGPNLTPAPSNVVIVPKEAAFKGTIVYAKGGNVWIQTGDQAHQLTTDGGASMPSWSPDGQSIYYIRTRPDRGFWPTPHGGPSHYDLLVPDLMRIPADGSAAPTRLMTGGFTKGQLKYSAWIREPVLSHDGSTIAMVTDAPNPDNSNVVLQFYDTRTKKLRRAGVRETANLGHQDPEWSPDGRYLLYVQNGRDGMRGAPQIMRYDTTTKTARPLSPTGYLAPSYSPDGRYIAATRTSNLGTDVAILDSSTGSEISRITNDGASWGPAWSPAGDAIAFLHIEGQTVDLRLVKLQGTAPSWTVSDAIPLTEVSDLDPASRPDWFIPSDQLPAGQGPSATPAPSSPAASSPAASSSP